jgi:ubiquinone/menaquinone biosynthesis C-methylase UbiE
MYERRYSGTVERLRLPERLALLEVDRVVNLAMEGSVSTTVLDVGTGSGVFAEAFLRLGLAVTGIDPNLEMLTAAKQFAPAAIFIRGMVENLPFEDRSYDLIFLGLVLHESDDLNKAMREVSRCARKRVSVLEWPYSEEEIGPPLQHRLRAEDIVNAAASVGLTPIESVQLNHLLLFRFAS